MSATKLLAGAATGLLLAGACYVGAAEQARRLAASLTAIPGVHAARISVDPWAGRVVADGVTAEEGPVRISAAHTTYRLGRFPLFALISPALALGGTASADDVEIRADTLVVRIPRIEAAATGLTDSDLAALLDPKSKLTVLERLQKLSAASVTIPQVIFDVGADDVSGRAAFRNIVMVDVAKGAVGAVSVAGGSLNVSLRGAPGPVQGTFGTLIARDLDLAGFARMATPRSNTAEGLRTLVDELSFDGMQLKAAEAFDLSLGAVHAERVRARPTLSPLGDVINAVLSNYVGYLNDEQKRALGTAVADLPESIAVGLAEVGGLSVKVVDASKTTSIDLGRVSMGGLARARLREMTFAALAVRTPDGRVRFNSLALHGLDVKPFLDAVSARLSDPQAGPVAVRDILPTLDQVSLAGVDADVPTVGLGNAHGGARDVFRVDKLEYSGSEIVRGVPTGVSCSIEGVDFAIDSHDGNMRPLAELGYTKVGFSAKLVAHWKSATRDFVVDDMSLSGVDMGAVSLKAAFANVGKELFSGDPAAAQAAMLAANAKLLEVRIDNAGLFEKALALDAKRSGRSPDQKRGEYISAVATAIPQMLDNSPVAGSLVNAVVKFIGAPKSLHLVATSQQGVSAADAMPPNNPSSILGKMDVTIAADE